MAGLHGGRRAGAGRKPGPQRTNVLGMYGRELTPRRAALPPALTGDELEGLLQAPDGLSGRAKECWTRFAPRAAAERTLTPATTAGFVELCEQWAHSQAVQDRIALLGAGTQDAIPYMQLYLRLAQRLDASLARYRLTAFGKPVTSDKPKAVENPWAGIAKPAAG